MLVHVICMHVCASSDEISQQLDLPYFFFSSWFCSCHPSKCLSIWLFHTLQNNIITLRVFTGRELSLAGFLQVHMPCFKTKIWFKHFIKCQHHYADNWSLFFLHCMSKQAYVLWSRLDKCFIQSPVNKNLHHCELTCHQKM